MANGFYRPPMAINEPKLDYEPGTYERKELKQAISDCMSTEKHIKMYIGGKWIDTDDHQNIHPPHDLSHNLGTYAKGEASHVQKAVEAALDAKEEWANMPWEERAAVFLKAADLLTGPYRAKMNAATMVCQSKNVWQAEIDCVCELADFWRFNAQFMSDIYEGQPQNSDRIWNRTEYRPLEGFVFAITPFNFTSIAGNLPTAPALMGNTVVWKPAMSQIYSAQLIMEILEEAGLPAGVINLIFVDGPVAGDYIFSHPEFAGLHFTGSTSTFKFLWKTIGNNIDKYNTYPRIVGETGGKDFVIAHPSADVEALVTALARGAFEYQGQKCSAVARAYIPSSMWPDVKEQLLEDINSFSMGSPEDFSNFINAVIDEGAFEKITGYIDRAAEDDEADILIGGSYDSSEGYFIEPTVVLTSNPKYLTMKEEIFGPVLTIYVYEDNDYEETLRLLDDTSPYGLTGAVFSQDRKAINQATEVLRYAAGNFYINDKPTGAVVGQQPFGGARESGTNDKAGSVLNLYRWVSQRNIKENFVPSKDYRYPFMEEK